MPDTLPNHAWTMSSLAECCEEVAQRIDNPAESGLDRFVGLEHLETGETSVRNWGSTEDVTSSMKLFKTGDVIVARRNVYLQRAALASFDGVCSGDGIVLRGNPEVCLPDLLPFLLNTDGFWSYVTSQADGTMSKRITVNRLLSYKFALPPLEEQRRIARVLQANRKVDERFSDVARNTRLLRASLIAHHVGTESLTQRKEARADRKPRPGWEPLKLSDLSNVVRGSTPRPARDPRYFGGDYVPWITVGELTKDDSPYLEQTESMLTAEGAERSRTVPEGTVVLSNSGYSLGIPKILGLTGCANDGVAAFLDLHPRLDSLFLYYWLLGLTEYFRKVVAAGGDQPNLNTERIGNLVIEVPPVEEQKEILQVLTKVDSFLDHAVRRAQVSRRLSKRLRCKAFDELGPGK